MFLGNLILTRSNTEISLIKKKMYSCFCWKYKSALVNCIGFNIVIKNMCNNIVFNCLIELQYRQGFPKETSVECSSQEGLFE